LLNTETFYFHFEMFKEQQRSNFVYMPCCYVHDDPFGHYQTVRHLAVYVVSVMLLSCKPVCSPYQAMWWLKSQTGPRVTFLLFLATGVMHFVSDVINDDS